MAPSTPPPSPPSIHPRLDLASIQTLISTVNHHLHRLLTSPSPLQTLMRQCASKLSSATRHCFDFSDHAVLSNLYWGISNLSNADLSTAEHMLQVPALLDELGHTAGVENRYLVCCSYFCLALVRVVQGDEWQAAMHLLQAVLVSPRYVMEFVPELCGEIWCGGEGEEEVRRIGRRYKDWLMYYQVVSYGERRRRTSVVAVCPRDRKLRTSLQERFERAKDPCAVEGQRPVSHKEIMLKTQHALENKGIDGETIATDKPSIATLLELQSLAELEEPTFRRLDDVYYQDSKECFDIKCLQEMLEDSQSDTTDSFYSEIGSPKQSDIKVMADNSASTAMTLSANADERNSGKVSSSSRDYTEINTAEACRYSMQIETSCSLSSKPRSSVSDVNLSILDIRGVQPHSSYKYYMEYSTPPGKSPVPEFACFGYVPAKFLQKYGFAELFPHGGFVKRKLKVLSLGKDWSEENTDYENESQIKFPGTLEKDISSICLSEGLGRFSATSSEVMSLWEMLTKSGAKFNTLKEQILFQLLDVVSNSKEEKFIRASISTLYLLISEDKSVIEEIKKNTSCFSGLARALKENVYEAAVLIYMLKPSPSELRDLEILSSLLEVTCSAKYQNWKSVSLPLSPRAASIAMIEILVNSFDSLTNSMHLTVISSPSVVSKLVNVLRNKILEECIALSGILVKCMRLSGNCRKFLSQVTPIDPFLHLLKVNKKPAKIAALEYFHEILRMPRSSAIVLLHQIRQQGGVSILHNLLAYIQQEKQEHKLLAANLLLQLDMVENPCGKSVFKEEALEVLVESIVSEDCCDVCILSAFILSNIGGTYAWTGEPYTAAWLVKKAGLASIYNRHMIRNVDWHDPCLQDNEMETWSSKIAKGLLKIGSPIFRALAKGLQSNIRSVSRDSLVCIAWLGCELMVADPSNLRYFVCEILIGGIARFLHPGSDLDERVIASLCIYNFASGKGMQKLMNFSEGVRESLRRLSSITWMAEELLKVTDYFIPTKPRVSCVHTQIVEAGKVGSGGVTALVFYKGHLCGGYADGSIKVWDIKGQTSRLVYEVKDHKKSVTCFSLFEPGDKLLSGSADRTIKVWQMVQKKFECSETIDTKEPVHRISSYGDRIFVSTQNRGLKVYRSSKIIRTFCRNKVVKCITVAQSKLYLGCGDSSIQEVDAVDNKEQEIRAPKKSTWIMHNKPICSVCMYKGLLYSSGANVEETNVKDWRSRNKAVTSIVLEKGSSIQEMVVVEDFIYLSCISSPSIFQIWLRGKQQKVGRLSAGSKITSLIAMNDIVLCGTETGLIKGWIPL